MPYVTLDELKGPRRPSAHRVRRQHHRHPYRRATTEEASVPPAPPACTTRPEPWNPASTGRNSRAISLTIPSPNKRNGPPKNPTDRHEISKLAGEGPVREAVHDVED